MNAARRARQKSNREENRKPVGIQVEYTSGRVRTFPIPVDKIPVVDRPKEVARKKESPLVRTARIVPIPLGG